jgi:hypothetical protein
MRKSGFVVAAMLVCASAASAQVGTVGPPGSGSPVWVDLNDNGVVDPGETTLYPEAVSNPGAPLPIDQLYIVLRNNPFDPGNSFGTRINPSPCFNPTSVTRRHTTDPRGQQQTVTFRPSGSAFSIHFVESYVSPALVSATGDATFLDTDGDGVFDTLQISGSHRSVTVPLTNISFAYKDVNGDGKADYISIDWALSGLLGVKAGDHQVWFPLKADASGLPFTVGVALPDPSSAGASCGIDVPLRLVPQSQGGAGALGAPALSKVGLLALSGALAAAGVLLLRGRTFV